MDYVILAPHIDDEFIGCYRLLCEHKIKKVIYFFDLTEERIKEAKFVSENYKFEPIFCNDIENLNSHISDSDVLLVPNIKDNHIHHKKINMIAKKLKNKKLYYSADMNTKFDVLSESIKNCKKDLLTYYYPSQEKLFENEKYFLFESLLESDIEKYIFINTSFEGFHCYPNAPDAVHFLKHVHRHIFHVNVKISVFHNDRELEFILFKREIENFIHEDASILNNKSCEMIGEEILNYLVKKYEGRNIYIIVGEDGENGAEVKYEIGY